MDEWHKAHWADSRSPGFSQKRMKERFAKQVARKSLSLTPAASLTFPINDLLFISWQV
jgi:hypothetical protein